MTKFKELFENLDPFKDTDKKEFYTRGNVGSSKYTINVKDGKKTHPDGSEFFGIEIFKNKKKYEARIKELINQGYKER